jgi:hypothetical protein
MPLVKAAQQHMQVLAPVQQLPPQQPLLVKVTPHPEQTLQQQHPLPPLSQQQLLLLLPHYPLILALMLQPHLPLMLAWHLVLLL